MFISYKLSRKSIGSLKKQGFSEQSLRELQAMEDLFFATPDTFLHRVSKLEHSKEIMAREQQLLKAAKGYFRLDQWIRNKTLREWVEALVFALVVASIVRTFLFAPFQIPSGSMLPTIQLGDHIFASMYSYGSPIPFAGIKVLEKPIVRGDIVIFPYPQDPDIDYIKRVIGMPGETLEIRKNQVFINEVRLDEPYAFCQLAKSIDENTVTVELTINCDDSKALNFSRISNYGPKSIPEGKLFVMGDNRFNSQDSRYWGFVDVKDVVGKGQMIYWSHHPHQSLFGGYRFGRIFTFLK